MLKGADTSLNHIPYEAVSPERARFSNLPSGFVWVNQGSGITEDKEKMIKISLVIW